MLTIFACPKAFRGHIGVIQRNAIRSWTLLQPRPEIILFGDDDGVAQAATELGVRYSPEIARNEFGTPLLDDLFGQARQLASFPVLAYVNADIILLQDFISAVERVRAWRPRFLIVGQRTDLELREPWDFADPQASDKLRSLALNSGTLRPPNWIDYFVFSKGLIDGLLPLALGRTRWDNWLIWHARHAGVPVIDASRMVLALHQNHDYSHHAQGEEGAFRGLEAQRNAAMAGGWWRHCTTADATFTISSDRIRRNPGHWLVKVRRAAHHTSAPILFPIYDFTRPLRHYFRLRRHSPADTPPTSKPATSNSVVHQDALSARGKEPSSTG